MKTYIKNNIKNTFSLNRNILNPKLIDSILYSNSDNFEIQQSLFDLMQDTWPRLLKNINQIKRAVSSLKWSVFAYKDTKGVISKNSQKKADVCSVAFENFMPEQDTMQSDFEETIFNILDAYFCGISVSELIFKLKNNLILPVASLKIDPSFFCLDEAGNFKLSLSSNKNDLIDFPKHKFLISKCISKGTSLKNAALLRPLAKYWAGSEYGYKWLASYAQKFGEPFRVASYESQSQEDIQNIADMLENMGASGWAAFPKGTDFQFLSSSANANTLPQTKLMELADKACDILILGQTLTSDASSSGSLALGEVHQSVLNSSILNAVSFVEKVINYQLIASVVYFNFGNTENLPYIKFEIPQAKDEVSMANRDSILKNQLGVNLTEQYLKERYDIV